MEEYNAELEHVWILVSAAGKLRCDSVCYLTIVSFSFSIYKNAHNVTYLSRL